MPHDHHFTYSPSGEKVRAWYRIVRDPDPGDTYSFVETTQFDGEALVFTIGRDLSYDDATILLAAKLNNITIQDMIALATARTL